MERLCRIKDCVALVETDAGYMISIISPGGYRFNYQKRYKRYADAEQAWYSKLGEVHGLPARMESEVKTMSDPLLWRFEGDPPPMGAIVMTIRDHTIDYSDCDYGGIYDIPSGSCGTVISPPKHFNCDTRVAVRFSDTPNYPDLVFEGKRVGAGHYIRIDNLMPAHTEDDKIRPVDIDGLF